MNPADLLLPDPSEIPAESIAPVIARLASLQTALAARLLDPGLSVNTTASGPEREDELLTVADAARLLNVSEDWMYRRAARLPFARRLSRKALRFSKAGLLRWRAARTG